MSSWTIRPALSSDRDELAVLRSALWPEGSTAEHSEELEVLLRDGMNGSLPMSILVAQDGGGKLAGFIEVGLRSHADGCDTRRPVGFVEGWFVDPHYRRQGMGRALMVDAEAWARSLGCLEMASDSLLDNVEAHRTHLALGFEIVDRCVNFKKRL